MGKRITIIDPITFICLVLLASFGLFVLLTIKQSLFISQFIYFILGIVFLYIFSKLDNAVLWWFAPFGYILSLGLLATSFMSPAIRGAVRWIVIGPIQLQPSELIKPFMLLAFARFMSQYPPRNLRFVPFHFILFIIPIFFVLKQPDLGTAIVYALFWLAMMIATGLKLRILALALLFGAIVSPLMWHRLAPYQQTRIQTFFDSRVDPQGTGYNALQATIAVGSGQLMGRGLGRGTQSHLRFLPEFHTDFIFATIVEELGFFGGILLFLGYFVLLWRIVSLYLAGTENIFAYSYALGVVGMIISQVFINTGMNMGIVPITGITLPFVSYGGSSLISLSISVGILWAFHRTKNVGHVIAIGRST